VTAEAPLTQPAPLFWRLPIVRHIRWAVHARRVGGWYRGWASLGYYETNNFDRRCLDQIWRGIV
jgi:hypothetical protein